MVGIRHMKQIIIIILYIKTNIYIIVGFFIWITCNKLISALIINIILLLLGTYHNITCKTSELSEIVGTKVVHLEWTSIKCCVSQS
jgi:hypothetical protein